MLRIFIVRVGIVAYYILAYNKENAKENLLDLLMSESGI